jgi:CheY-like chemotaxis protein
MAGGLLPTHTAMAGKILIVEDNSDLSQILALCLNGAGYETSQAGNSAEGIRKALTEQPDLILTDLSLPDMTAVEATAILKNNPVTSGIPIVVLSGIAVREWKTKALKAGAADYLIKPISPPDLVEAIRKFCRSVITEL